eukprot:6981303-Karenia_brevis.AAC.1
MGALTSTHPLGLPMPWGWGVYIYSDFIPDTTVFSTRLHAGLIISPQQGSCLGSLMPLVHGHRVAMDFIVQQ